MLAFFSHFRDIFSKPPCTRTLSPVEIKPRLNSKKLKIILQDRDTSTKKNWMRLGMRAPGSIKKVENRRKIRLLEIIRWARVMAGALFTGENEEPVPGVVNTRRVVKPPVVKGITVQRVLIFVGRILENFTKFAMSLKPEGRDWQSLDFYAFVVLTISTFCLHSRRLRLQPPRHRTNPQNPGTRSPLFKNQRSHRSLRTGPSCRTIRSPG